VGAAVILAQTGDPARYDSPQTWVKHGGLAPQANESGKYRGRTRSSGRGRSDLRTATWRVMFGAVRCNPVYAARLAFLTTREGNRLSAGQPTPRWPRRCSASCTWWSPAACPGIPPSPPAPPGPLTPRWWWPSPDAILVTAGVGEPGAFHGQNRLRAWAPRPPPELARMRAVGINPVVR
jgi:transposase IS116/IS110/IS902 family protein